MQTTVNFAQQIRKMPIRCGEAPGLRRQPDPELGRQRDLALQGRVRRVRAGDRQGDRRRAGHADGAVLPQRPARARHRAARRRAPARSPTATASTSRPRCRSWSRRATSGRRPARASTSTGGNELMEQATAQQTGAIVERFTLKAFLEACLVLEEGVSSLKDIEIGMMTGAGILPGPVRPRRRARPRRDARGARARRGRVGRALRAADRSCAGWSRRAGSARRPARASSPTRSPTRDFDQKETVLLETRGDGRDHLAQPPAREPAQPAGDHRVRRALEALPRERRDPLGRDRVVEHLHVLGRRRHQGVHEDGRVRRRGPARLGPRDAARDGDARARRRSRR